MKKKFDPEYSKKLIPAKAKSTLGVLIEANIFERPKVILGHPPSHKRVDYSTEINVGLRSFICKLSFGFVFAIPTLPA